MASFVKSQTIMLRSALRKQVASSSSPLLPCTALRSNHTAAAAGSSSAYTAPSTESSQASGSEPLPQQAQALADKHGLVPVRYSYFVPRVGRLADSLPVYTDVRNGGTRVMTEVRRVEGNISDLRKELVEFLADTYNPTTLSYLTAEATHEASRLAAERNAAEPHIPFLPHNGRTPNRLKVNRKSVAKAGHPTALEPVQTSVVIQSGKLKIRGNRVRKVKEFLESRGF